MIGVELLVVLVIRTVYCLLCCRGWVAAYLVEFVCCLFYVRCFGLAVFLCFTCFEWIWDFGLGW